MYGTKKGAKRLKNLIAIPAYESMPVGFVKSLIDLQIPEGTTISIIPNTLIYEARNLIAQKAVENEFDRVLWLDADMIIPRDAMIRLLSDVNIYGDMVTGLYFQRRAPTSPVISSDVPWTADADGSVHTSATAFNDYPRNKVFPIKGAGFGCCMTTGRLLKAMVETYGSPFTPLMGLGEDFAFCWRASKLGFELYCDSRIKCGHIGQIIFDESIFRAQLEPYERRENTHFPGGSKTCSNCEYGRSTICNDHGEAITNPETQSCPEWRERIKREYET